MKLNPEKLYHWITADTLGLPGDDTTAINDGCEIPGQPRAVHALNFGLSIDQPGYHIYLAGEAGSGRTRFLLNQLQPQASQQQTPSDWLYVYNFEKPMEPRVISLPHQQGRQLLRDIDTLIDALLDSFPAAFDNPSYQQRRNTLRRQFDQVYEAALAQVKHAAGKCNIAMYHEEGLVSFSPLIDGVAADEAQFASLSETELEDFNGKVEQLETLLGEVLLELPQWQRELNDHQRQLREQTISPALKLLFQPLQHTYSGHTATSLYLAQLLNHLPRIIDEQFGDPGHEDSASPAQLRKMLESRYQPQLLRVAADEGAPVIHESNPNYQNLFGRISSSRDESGITYQQISAGAVHRANGGYLIVDIEKLLQDEYSWPALLRMLRDKRIDLEPSPAELLMNNSSPLQPESIPLQIKVVLIGPRSIYYALDEYDRDFNELFRVLVDFDERFPGSRENLQQFSRFIHSRARESGIARLSNDAIARLAEHSQRLAEHQQQLSAHIDAIIEIAIEADYQRKLQGDDGISRAHIDASIEARHYRNARLRDRQLEEILDGTVVISSDGLARGQINGLSVLQIGDSSFGCPSRITASAHPGSRGVVDIEREAELGRSAHSKGVMILTGYLCSFYAHEFPLAMSAHIAMEQSYGHIDGDSASLAELCALLSALVGQPLRQDLAVTGSINQRGEIQAVGGVNEKVECFFDLCQARGLTGQQGVVLPASNQRHLMLSQRVIDAVEQHRFSVYGISTVNEALALLTGKEPGFANSKGLFPKGTFNDRVMKRLQHFAQLARSQG